MTKEQIKAMNESHKAVVQQKENIFRQEIQTINERATQQINNVRQEAEVNNKKYQEDLKGEN